jgi:hypothetical protein
MGTEITKLKGIAVTTKQKILIQKFAKAIRNSKHGATRISKVFSSSALLCMRRLEEKGVLGQFFYSVLSRISPSQRIYRFWRASDPGYPEETALPKQH